MAVRLAELSDELRQLFGSLNFLDVEENEQSALEKDLDSLQKVVALVDIAADLFPFHKE